jgi:hypothetical protein
MLGLDSIAGIASCDMSYNIPLHVLPPKHLPQVSIHLRATWVDAVLGIVRF